MRHMSTVFRPKGGTCQKVAIGTTSAATTNAFGAQTRAVIVDASIGCHVAIGAAPTATTADMHLAANTPYVIQVDPGEKLAVIDDDGASTGNLWVTEVTH